MHQNQPVRGVAIPDLEACEREPIHTPGSIQPYGLLLVVNPATDRVLQAAGDATALLGYEKNLDGGTTREVLGRSLEDLVLHAESVLSREPVFLGTVRPAGGREELTIIAHQVERAAVVELIPSGHLGSAAQALANIRSASERIGGACSLVEASDLAAAEFRRITGYDRVLVYKLLEDSSGSVIAEACHGQLPSLLNHRFPDSDIPAQARDLYRRNPIRIIPNVGYFPSPMVPALSPITDRPLDMSHCLLRSVSPIHIQYLKNMGVAASLSVSLLQRDDLWGLIACHNTTAKMLSYEALEACRHVAQILSQKIRALEDIDAHRLEAKLGAVRDKVMRRLFAEEDPGAALLTLGPELKKIVPSHGIAVSWKGSVVVTGIGPTESQVHDLAKCVERRMSGIDLFATDRLSEECSEAAVFAPEASGLLCLRLTGDQPVTLMWFRAEQVEEINWAGNPHKAFAVGEVLGALTPRTSFSSWQETVRRRSRHWSAVELNAVKQFSLRLAFVLQQATVREINDRLSDAIGRLAAVASTDGLTQIPNRRAFDERKKVEWARANRSRASLALLTLDVDYFKRFNDFYGHAMGDTCLKQVARALQEERRAADFAARVGGEEFSLVLPDTAVEGAVTLAEKIRSRIEALQLPHAKSPIGIVTVSIGVAVSTDGNMETFEALMEVADNALYMAKKAGRNQVVFFDGRHSSNVSLSSDQGNSP